MFQVSKKCWCVSLRILRQEVSEHSVHHQKETGNNLKTLTLKETASTHGGKGKREKGKKGKGEKGKRGKREKGKGKREMFEKVGKINPIVNLQKREKRFVVFFVLL